MRISSKSSDFVKKAFFLGALSSSSAFFFAPVASADVLEFKNGEVKTHVAVDFRNRPFEAIDAPAVATVTITQWIQPSEDIAALIETVASEYEIDPLLITAVMAQESNFNVLALSPKGAMGLMQLMPETAIELGVTEPYDAAQNIDGGARYLKSLLGRYNGDRYLALAAYNAGTRAVDSYGGVPPYPETREYILRINDRYNATKPKAVAVEAPAPLKMRPSLLAFGGGDRVDGTFVTIAEPVETELPQDVSMPELPIEDIELELPAAQSATVTELEIIDLDIIASRVPDSARTIVKVSE